MRILAFDTSGPWCGTALFIDGRIVSQRHEKMPRGQAERLMPMLGEVMAAEGAVWEELDGIVVGTGPGNFTGIRVGVAAARGLALGLGVPAVGVTAFEAMMTIGSFEREQQIISIPSQHQRADVILQLFESARAKGDPIEVGLGICAPFDPEPFRILPNEADIFGTNAERLAWIFLTEFGRKLDDGFEPDPDLIRPPAELAAQAAAKRLASGNAIPRPAPLYIRPADAAPPSDPPPVILP